MCNLRESQTNAHRTPEHSPRAERTRTRRRTGSGKRVALTPRGGGYHGQTERLNDSRRTPHIVRVRTSSKPARHPPTLQAPYRLDSDRPCSSKRRLESSSASTTSLASAASLLYISIILRSSLAPTRRVPGGLFHGPRVTIRTRRSTARVERTQSHGPVRHTCDRVR